MATRKSKAKSSTLKQTECPEFEEHVCAEDALKLLKDGNKRYVSKQEQGRCNEERRKMFHDTQRPWAVVLTCADSRVSPELVFDAGIGDLFVVRVAGNIANACSIASIEYAIANLPTDLIVVLGHENCGAVAASLKRISSTHSLNQLLGHLTPVAREYGDDWAKATKKEKLKIEYDASRYNARSVARQLKAQSPEVMLEHPTLQIVPAIYETGTGKVCWERKSSWQ